LEIIEIRLDAGFEQLSDLFSLPVANTGFFVWVILVLYTLPNGIGNGRAPMLASFFGSV
jgi:hypothetical protein